MLNWSKNDSKSILKADLHLPRTTESFSPNPGAETYRKIFRIKKIDHVQVNRQCKRHLFSTLDQIFGANNLQNVKEKAVGNLSFPHIGTSHDFHSYLEHGEILKNT